MKKRTIALAVLALTMLSVGAYVGLGYVSATPEYTAKFVSGTEYRNNGEAGQTIVRMSDKDGIGVVADWCNATIYLPNKTAWYTNTPMILGGSTGSWYLSWTTPDDIGNYEEYVACYKSGKTFGISSSFHVSSALSEITQINNSVNTVTNNLNQVNQTVTEINDTLNQPQLNIVS